MPIGRGSGAGVRPRVTVNVAMSLDGRIAGRDGRPMFFSDEADQRRVHQMRAEHDAILVGVGTVLADDPGLLVKRRWVPEARDPLRVVLDASLRTPAGARVFSGEAATRVYHREGLQGGKRVGVSFVSVPQGEGGQGRLDLQEVLRDLVQVGVRSLMVEGGSRVIGSFLSADLVDELFIFVAPVVVGPPAPSLASAETFEGPLLARFAVVDATHRESGVLMRLEPRDR